MKATMHAIALLMMGSTAVLSSVIPKINVTHTPAEILDLQPVASHKYNITWGKVDPSSSIRLSRVYARQSSTDDIGRRYSVVDDPGFLSMLTTALLEKLIAFPYDGEAFWTQDVAHAVIDRDYNRIFTMPQQAKVEAREKEEKQARKQAEKEERKRIKEEKKAAKKAAKKARKEEKKRLHEEAKARGESEEEIEEAEEKLEKEEKEAKKAKKEEKERIEDEEEAKEKENKRIEKEEEKRREKEEMEKAREFLREKEQYMTTRHGMYQYTGKMKVH